MKYKVQPYTNDPLELEKLPSVIKQVLFNQFCVQIPFSIIFHPFVYVRGSIHDDYVRPIPAAWRILLDFIVFEITREISFYYIHRLLHHPQLYKKYHKMHHGNFITFFTNISTYFKNIFYTRFDRMDISNRSNGPILSPDRTFISEYISCCYRTFYNGIKCHFCRNLVCSLDIQDRV